MRDGTEEWKTICEQAAKEKDPEKLMKLTRRIAELLDQRLLHKRSGNVYGPPPQSEPGK